MMDRCIDGQKLNIEVISFQTFFVKALIKTIRKRLQDLVTLLSMKMSSPMNMSMGSTSIASRKQMGLIELKTHGKISQQMFIYSSM